VVCAVVRFVYAKGAFPEGIDPRTKPTQIDDIMEMRPGDIEESLQKV
jgi:hypothetical protein